MQKKAAAKTAKKPAPAKTNRRPVDPNRLAHAMIQEMSERQENEMPVSPSEISRVMAELGRRGGKIGGKKRAAAMTPERRREIALKAARSRWDKE